MRYLMFSSGMREEERRRKKRNCVWFAEIEIYF
jgi:hypothetical protein